LVNGNAEFIVSKPEFMIICDAVAESQFNFLNQLQVEVDKQDKTTLNPVFKLTGVEGWLKNFPDRSHT